MKTLITLIQLLIALFLLAMIKVTLRTNPEIAIPVLVSSAAIAAFYWFVIKKPNE